MVLQGLQAMLSGKLKCLLWTWSAHRGGVDAQALSVHSISDSHTLASPVDGLILKLCHSRGQLSPYIYSNFKQ